MNLTDLLEEWTAIHEKHVGMPMPRQPASDDDIAALEAAYGCPFPDELRALLKFSNGIDHDWTGNGVYNYFPELDWAPLTIAQVDWFSTTTQLLIDIAELPPPRNVADGDPDHTVTKNSVPLFGNAGGDEYGLVLNGWAKGGIWQLAPGEVPSWKARNLTEFVEDCIAFEQRGLLIWDRYLEDIGCVVADGWGGFGSFPRDLNRPTEIEFGSA